MKSNPLCNNKYSFVFATLAVIPLIFSACSVVDPNNIIGRQKTAFAISNVPVPPPVNDDSWKREALDKVWTTINERYYDPKLNGVDWVAVRKRYEPLIAKAGSDDEYWELLDKMAGELKDAHTRVESPKQVAQQRDQESHSLGITFTEIDGKLVLLGVHPESDAWWAGARAGMSIDTIDGEPALGKYQRLVSEARLNSTPWARARSGQRKILSGDIGSKISMTFLRNDGTRITATMSRRKFRVVPEAIHRVLPSGYGYIRFSAFNEALRGNVLSAIEEMKDVPGMIVDLRNNGGGSGDMAIAIMSKFFAEDKKGGRVLTRDGKPISIFFYPVLKIEPELKGSRDKAYLKPLVVLTNNASASASEIFSGNLQDAGRATVIGQRTCGCLLGYLGYADLPGGGQMAYSEIGFVTSKGKRIEGEGVMPDVEVKIATEDLILSRDRTLEAAEAFLAKAVADKQQPAKK